MASTAFSTVFASRDPELIGRSLGARAASSRCWRSSCETLLSGVSAPADSNVEQIVGNKLALLAKKQAKFTKDRKKPDLAPRQEKNNQGAQP